MYLLKTLITKSFNSITDTFFAYDLRYNDSEDGGGALVTGKAAIVSPKFPNINSAKCLRFLYVVLSTHNKQSALSIRDSRDEVLWSKESQSSKYKILQNLLSFLHQLERMIV